MLVGLPACPPAFITVCLSICLFASQCKKPICGGDWLLFVCSCGLGGECLKFVNISCCLMGTNCNIDTHDFIPLLFLTAYCPKVVVRATPSRAHACKAFMSLLMKLSWAQMLMRASWACSWRLHEHSIGCSIGLGIILLAKKISLLEFFLMKKVYQIFLRQNSWCQIPYKICFLIKIILCQNFLWPKM